VAQFTPESGNYYVKQNTEQYSIVHKQYSRSCSWVITASSGVNLNGMPNVIHSIP